MKGERIMKYLRNKKFSSSLPGGLLVLIVLLAVSQVWARDPVPQVKLVFPGVEYSYTVTTIPAGYSFPVVPKDEDGIGGRPLKYRYLLKEAVIDGVVINTSSRFEQYKDQLVPFDDPQWSSWIDLRLADESQPRILMPTLDEESVYILAAQVLDADGTASMDLLYGWSAINFRVSDHQFRPCISVYEPFLGEFSSSVSFEIAAGQPLNFTVSASASAYGGTISSLRYGWDVADPDDADDPGWAVPAGIAEDYLQVPQQAFFYGIHSLVVRAEDSFGNSHDLSWSLNVVPFVSPENQLPLLFIDQVVDNYSNVWPDASGSVFYDQEQHRDEYWSFLEGSTGVQDFIWERDHLNHTASVSFSDIVQYKTVMVNARAHVQQTLFQQFRPQNGQDRFVWLAPYQTQGGNLFLVGDRSMESFLEQLNYMVPLVFDTNEWLYLLDDQVYTVGFGVREDPDGNQYNRGTRMYPFQTAGLSLLDWSSPIAKNVYARSQPAIQDRTPKCSGLKAMTLSENFRSQHQVDVLAIADTLWTNPDIDWRDGLIDSLNTNFPFTGDEFVDANISSRTTPWSRQECADGVDGFCLEPMFQGVSRFDWLREKRWAEGETDWPGSQYSNYELKGICGEMALADLDTPGGVVPNGTALVNGQTYGYLSYKNVAQKPSGKADAYWGFDPYRFDQEESRKSVGWVLEYFGLQVNR